MIGPIARCQCRHSELCQCWLNSYYIQGGPKKPGPACLCGNRFYNLFRKFPNVCTLKYWSMYDTPSCQIDYVFIERIKSYEHLKFSSLILQCKHYCATTYLKY